ncbi:MAG: phosphocholine cytidylyltransferase family protein [Candidatus Marinimicrobia bacterium]|nr:phosphocholine cytidylyltransferase family protein [Candidatus Neomarinimicrobiota bacterium]MBL7009631.1 phosphocholine cytidylyltransferase family protein [Candidatus Neomarinimicrobiota bacterium]MBL7029626.1 phosphocholine cytidylyltransferase family protein [Candidatus Neomarinimicrobiota bacterium]
MKAVILAAGVSRRLYPVTYEMPKCLIEVGGKPILDHQLEALQSSGINDIVLVVGYFRESIMDHVQSNYSDMNVEFVVNHHYFETNTAYSLRLCKDQIDGQSFLLMNGDVLYPKEVLDRVIHAKHDTSLAVEIKPCGREEVKVIEGDDNRLVAIGKELIEDNSLGEFIGVAKFSTEFSTAFGESLDRLIGAGGTADYFEAAIHPLMSEHSVYYEDVSDLPCIEIDFIEDLEKARELVKSDWFN